MSLWNAVYSVLLCYLWEKEYWRIVVERFFSHRTHRSNRAFLRTVSNPQNASGRQRTQNVTAIVDINKVQHEAYILLIGVSRWSLPFPSGEGTGEGPLSSMSLCVLFFCVTLWEKEMSSVKENIVLCEGINTNRKDRDCQDISSATPLSFRGHAPLHWRRRLSAIEKRPFKGQEHAPLEARKACSRTLFVKFWLLAGYKLEERGEYTSIS